MRDLLRASTRSERSGGRLARAVDRPARSPTHRAPTERVLGGRTLVGDPVDVATGEVVLRQVDVDLAGALPLILCRTHLSSYRRGGLFGASWASTLDQRLEFGPAGARFLAEDGGVIAAGDDPRWPLIERSDGTHALTDTEHGRVLHFGPPDLGGPSRPLVAITDRNGHRVDIDRDAAGVPRAVRHSGGYAVAVDTRDGLVTGLRVNDQHLLTFTYTDGLLTAIVNWSGLPYRLEYDPDGRLTAWTDRTGTRCEYRYDGAGRCVQVTGTGGYRSARLAYHPRRTEVTDSLGALTRFDLNARGQVVREVDPLGNATTSRWDQHDRLLSRTDPLRRTTRYRYDTRGNLTAITRPDGAVARTEYNALGLPVRVREPDGTVWRRRYDRRGNLVALTDPAGATTRYRYDTRGNLAAIVDALGHRRRVDTNAAGLVTALTDPLGARTRLDRDGYGRVVAITDPLGATTRLTWSPDGRLLARTDPAGATTSWTHDPDGRVTAETGPLGAVTTTDYGPFDLPTAETAPDGARLRYAYDTELRLTAVTDARGRTWRYEYDPAGRLRAERDYTGHRTTYTHDAAGQLTTRTTPTGDTTAYAHDPLGRLTANGAITYAYDLLGRLTRATSPTSELTLTRDPLGNVLTETVDGRTVTSGYDRLGRRHTRRTPSGTETTWSYDPNHQPATLHAAGHTIRFGYDPAGRETARHTGDHLLLTTTWNPTHAPLTQSLLAGPRLIAHTAYTYRADGYRTATADLLAGPHTYALDEVGRITAVTTPHGTEAHSYDPTGALVAPRTAYRHDPAGRVTHRTDPSGRTWTYAYDPHDRLTDLHTPTGDHWRYLYDPLGRRTAKQRLRAGAVAEETTFTWDADTLAEQHTPTSTTTWAYTPGTHRPLLQITDDRCYAVLTDPLGTPTNLVDLFGVITWHHTTTLWGTTIGTTDPTTCPLRFPGQYADPESALHYNHHRYYDPTTAHYLTPDPLRLTAGPTPHTYVPNPLHWTDPQALTPDQTVDLYHATRLDNAASIRRAGIDLTASRRSLDFGPGFYTTRDLAQALRWADRPHVLGEVLHYRVPQLSLDRLYGRTFAVPDADWTKLVRQMRARAGMHPYDWVEGPMVHSLRGLRTGGPLNPGGNQLSFHTEAAIKILDRYLQ